MIILFAPAKTFKEGKISNNLDVRFNQTKDLISKLKNWDKDHYLKNFGISEDIYNEVFLYYNNFDNDCSYEAFTLFNGQSYVGLEYDSLSDDDKDYLHDKVYVIDALYGIIKPKDGIKRYRLDFTVKNLDIKKVWKKEINDYFKTIDDKEILSLSSNEFSSILSRDNNIYDVSFVNIVNGKKKKVSVFNKQMRGKLLRYIIKNKINSINDLPFYFEGYELLKNGNELIYEEKNS